MRLKQCVIIKTSEQQEKGVLSKQHNVFPKEQIIQLLNSNPKTSFNRPILLVDVSLGIRTRTFHQLTLDQFQKIKTNNIPAWRFSEKIGSTSGASKVSSGKWNSTTYNPVTKALADIEVPKGSIKCL